MYMQLPVMSEEDVVPLVMKGDHLSAPELWIMVEQRGKHSGNCVTQTSGEVVEYHLRSM